MKEIKLARGLPPLSVMRKLSADLLNAAQAGLQNDPQSFLQYGHFTGYAPLREHMAARFGVDAERVVISNGSMDALHHFLLYLKVTKGLARYAAAKEVYDRPLVIARKLGFELTGVDLTEEGPDLDQARAWAQKSQGDGVFYSIPWFDNPSGVNHSQANREALANLMADNGHYVVRDGAYLDLDYFNEAEYPAVPEHVLQTFTFSKTISAGLHLGGVIIPKAMVTDFNHFISSWRLSPVMPTQVMAWELIKSGQWDKHMRENVLPDGRERVSHFNKLMAEHLPESQRREIQGGHFWGGKVAGLTQGNWSRFVEVAQAQYGLAIPHHSGFMPLSPEEESVGYIRIPLFSEDAEIPDILQRIVTGIAGARDAVA